MIRKISLLLIVFLVSIVPVWADQEASNIIVVKAGNWGRVYAKSVPAEHYGTKGVTKIFQARRNTDKLLATLPWYSRKLYLQGNMVNDRGEGGVSVVMFGPWPRGQQPKHSHLAIAFYYNNRLLKRYSTLDIYNISGKAPRSVSHYQVIKKVRGYRWVRNNTYAFDIETFDGKVLSFNPVTGLEMKK